VPVDGPDPDAGAASHVVDLRLAAVLAERFPRCRQDLLAVAPRVGTERPLSALRGDLDLGHRSLECRT
jgi:hypothetical protein